MAQHRHVIVTDDIDGTEGARSYRFSWQDAYHEEADGLEETIQEAEDELEWRHQQQVEARRESRAQQAATAAGELRRRPH